MNTAGRDTGFSDSQITLIRSTVARNVPDAEFDLFLYQCERTGLDPLARQVYLIARGGKYTIQTSIDGMRLIADRTGRYAGSDAAVFGSDEAGEFCEATVHKLVGNPPIRVPFTARVYMDEYRGNTPTWKSMPRQMLAKTAEGAALRKGFPADLSGLYTQDETSSSAGESVTESVERGQPIPEVVQAEVVEEGPDDSGYHADVFDEIAKILDASPDGYFGEEEKILDYANRSLDHARISLQKMRKKLDEGEAVPGESTGESEPPPVEPEDEPDSDSDNIELTEEDLAAAGYE